mgnify:CR=1 FL=1
MEKKILGYIERGELTESDAKKLTHLHIAFGRLMTDGSLTVEFLEILKKLPQIRQWNPELKILLSLVPGNPDAFSVCSGDQKLRETVADSIKETVVKYDLDGIDLDWEFPCFPSNGVDAGPEDKPNFTLLCETIRRKLDQLTDKHYLFSIAAGADIYYVKSVELEKVSRYLDYICVMTYDLKCGFHALAGHHTSLYSNLGDVFMNSAHQALALFVEAGVPKEKLLLGAAFYSRKWTEIEDRNHGFLQIAKQGGGYGPDYAELYASYINKNGFVRYWDDEAKAPFLFDGSTFLSYDDEESLSHKTAYVRSEGYGGIFYWEHGCDATGQLLEVLYQGMKG